jgi:hypothetical protein
MELNEGREANEKRNTTRERLDTLKNEVNNNYARMIEMQKVPITT